MKLYTHVTMAALAAVIVFGVAGGGAAVTSSFPTTAAYADSENGKGWPKTVWYLPKSQEGPTGLTVAQCDSPEQCKEVNGTPSPNLAAKRFCEEISGEKCKKVKDPNLD